MPRNVFLIAGEISLDPRFGSVDTPEGPSAVGGLARSSKGMLHITENGDVHVLGALDELERRWPYSPGSLQRRDVAARPAETTTPTTEWDFSPAERPGSCR